MRFSPDTDLVAGDTLEFIKIFVTARADDPISGLVVTDRGSLEEAIIVIGAGWRRVSCDGEIINEPTSMLVGGLIQGNKVKAEADRSTGILG